MCYASRALSVVMTVAVLLCCVAAGPDSAGVVPLPEGLAYGGIPYGSVTGMVAEYYRQRAAAAELGNSVNSVYDNYLILGNQVIALE